MAAQEPGLTADLADLLRHGVSSYLPHRIAGNEYFWASASNEIAICSGMDADCDPHVAPKHFPRRSDSISPHPCERAIGNEPTHLLRLMQSGH